VKKDYGNASILLGHRVCFNIAGNKYRLTVHISTRSHQLNQALPYVSAPGTLSSHPQAVEPVNTNFPSPCFPESMKNPLTSGIMHGAQ
jgi:hypothetical protein